MDKRTNIKQVKKKINLFKKKVELAGNLGAKYILFGSWATGKAHKYSDIDLCVVSNKFSKNNFLETTRLRVMTIGIDDLLEPIAMRPEDYNDKYDTLATEVKKWGIEI